MTLLFRLASRTPVQQGGQPPSVLAVAAKVTQYPMFLSSVNRSELNDSAKIEKTIWISKKSYLPVKYQSVMSFSMTLEIVGALDHNTDQMNMLNQLV